MIDDPMSRVATDAADILRHFTYDRMAGRLREVSKEFTMLAHRVRERTPNDPEMLVALRKLLEAMEAARRCVASPARIEAPAVELGPNGAPPAP